MNEFRYSDFEFRQSDDGLGVVTGTVIGYGDIAKLPWGTEEFKAGAWGDFRSPMVKANRMHQRTQMLARLGGRLEIEDDDERMAFSLTLPDTATGRDTAIEIKEGLLTGASLEFRAIQDSVNEDTGHRIISRAQLFGFGIVDEPAYPGSVATMKRWAEYRTEYGLYVPELEAKPVTTQKSRRYFVMV